MCQVLRLRAILWDPWYSRAVLLCTWHARGGCLGLTSVVCIPCFRRRCMRCMRHFRPVVAHIVFSIPYIMLRSRLIILQFGWTCVLDVYHKH